MKKIHLTQNQVAIIDDSDFDTVSQFSWCAMWKPNPKAFYAFRGYRRHDGKKRTMYMHRFIVDAPPGLVVDHINHNTLDNRRSNLRICSTAENIRNQKLHAHASTSGFKGVSFSRAIRKWRSSIVVSRKHIHLGVFNSPIEAAIAYDAAAVMYFGEFALTNKSLGLLEVRI